MLSFDEAYRQLGELQETLEGLEESYWSSYRDYILKIADAYGIKADGSDMEDPEDIQEILLDENGMISGPYDIALRLAERYYSVEEWDDFFNGEELPDHDDRDPATVLANHIGGGMDSDENILPFAPREYGES